MPLPDCTLLLLLRGTQEAASLISSASPWVFEAHTSQGCPQAYITPDTENGPEQAEPSESPERFHP